METISFQCTACNGDYELDVTHFLERPNSLKCSHCGARPSSVRCHSLAQALDDLLSAMAAVRTKVRFELNLDSDALPGPYGAADDEEADEGGLGGGLDEDDFDDDDDDFDDEDDDDDDFDDDFDDDDDLEEEGEGDEEERY